MLAPVRPLLCNDTDFHLLWKQAQFASAEHDQIQLIQDDVTHGVQVIIGTEAGENVRSCAILQARVRLLLDLSRPSSRQLLGALKLVRLFARLVKLRHDVAQQQRDFVLQEYAVFENQLLQKITELDSRHRSSLVLACERGCLDYVVHQIEHNPKLFLDLNSMYAQIVIGHVLVQGMDHVLHALLFDLATQKKTCNILAVTSLHDIQFVRRLIESLLNASMQDMGVRDFVIRSFVFLLENCSKELRFVLGKKLRQLSQFLDPCKEIVSGRTLPDVLLERCRIPEDECLAAFFACDERESSSLEERSEFLKLPRMKELLSGYSRKQFVAHFNVIEVAIWFKVPAVELSSIFSCQAFELEVEKIRRRMPDALLHTYFVSAWQINRHHLRDVCYDVPTALPAGVSVQQLVERYESFSPIHNETFMLHSQPVVISKEHIQLFVERIRRKEFFIGTPRPDSPQFIEYYALLELYICSTIRLLDGKGNKDDWINCLKEYAEAATHCGGRYFATALSEYYKASNQGDSPKEKILRSLAQFRRVWFEQLLLNKGGDHNPNPFNRALREYGMQYGIEGASAAQVFDDPFGSLISKADVEASFFQSYIPKEVLSWLLESAKEADMKQALMDYYVLHPPVGWKREVYGRLRQEAYAILASTSSEKQKNDKLQLLLETVGIELQTGKTCLDVISEAQRHDFLEHYFFDEHNNIRIKALIHILTHLRVFQTTFQGENFLFEEKGVEKTDSLFWLIKKVGSLFLSLFH